MNLATTSIPSSSVHPALHPGALAGALAAFPALRPSVLIADDEPVVRFLTDEIAVVIFRYHTECIRRESGEPYGISGLETQIVRKTPKGWKLAHIHYSK